MKNINSHFLNYVFTITFMFVQVVTDIHDKFAPNSSVVTTAQLSAHESMDIVFYFDFSTVLLLCCDRSSVRPYSN